MFSKFCKENTPLQRKKSQTYVKVKCLIFLRDVCVPP